MMMMTTTIIIIILLLLLFMFHLSLWFNIYFFYAEPVLLFLPLPLLYFFLLFPISIAVSSNWWLMLHASCSLRKNFLLTLSCSITRSFISPPFHNEPAIIRNAIFFMLTLLRAVSDDDDFLLLPLFFFIFFFFFLFIFCIFQERKSKVWAA